MLSLTIFWWCSATCVWQEHMARQDIGPELGAMNQGVWSKYFREIIPLALPFLGLFPMMRLHSKRMGLGLFLGLLFWPWILGLLFWPWTFAWAFVLALDFCLDVCFGLGLFLGLVLFFGLDFLEIFWTFSWTFLLAWAFPWAFPWTCFLVWTFPWTFFVGLGFSLDFFFWGVHFSSKFWPTFPLCFGGLNMMSS